MHHNADTTENDVRKIAIQDNTPRQIFKQKFTNFLRLFLTKLYFLHFQQFFCFEQKTWR